MLLRLRRHSDAVAFAQTKRCCYVCADTAMLLPLRKPVRNPEAFCTFEKIRYSTTDEKRRRDQRSVCERVDVI